MQTLSGILDDLRAAASAEQYALAVNRLREVETDIGELRSRMEAAEETAIFSGEDPRGPRETLRQCDDDLRTIQVAIAGAEKRMREAEIVEDAQAMSVLGDNVARDAERLSALYATVRSHIAAAREAIFEAVPLAAKVDVANETLVRVGRRDMMRSTSRLRSDVMGEELPRAPHTVPRIMRDADKVLVALATGGRPWRPMNVTLSGAPVFGSPTPTPPEAVKPLRRAVA